jgi:DMSO/TMAO reductase YedYZ molybdopterin-dependent catalytic subunit
MMNLPEYIAFQAPMVSITLASSEKWLCTYRRSLLTNSMAGRSCMLDHGAPLRLVTPLKYGVKQIKQIGRITYMHKRPKDCWHEQGYDPNAGL